MILTGAALMAAASAGCATPQSATATTPMPGDVAGATGSLDAEERTSAREAMRGVVPAGFVALPATTLGVRRWSDVAGAAATAATSTEMAILRSEMGDGVATFSLVTLDSRPGRLVVERVAEPALVRPAATIGNFDEDVAAAGRLVAAFEAAMDAAAKRRKLEDYRPRSVEGAPR